jgi:hypothetical protein
MHWEIIKKSEIELWNEKLKQTNATLFQYPYYLIGKYNSALYKRFFLKYVQDDKEYAFAAVIKFGAFPFKAAIIDDGPVILQTGYDLKIMLDALINFLKKNWYVYLQIQPGYSEIEQLLNNNTEFKTEIHYPFHKKEEAEWNIYNQPEDKLLAGFKIQGRRKIVLAGRVPYKFTKLETDAQLKEVEQLFKEVEKTKNRRYIPFYAMLTIYKNGKKHNLSEIYGVYLNNELVNTVLIIKDAQCYYHFTSAMVVKGYKYNESPPAKLHLFIMRDCFYTENKSYYNISFGGSDSLIRFKELFNPVEVKKPPYYTCILLRSFFPFFKKLMPAKPTIWKEYLNT